MKNYFDSAPIDKEFKNVKRIVGTDFDYQIFKRNTDMNKLLLIKHPVESKNYNIEKTFDKFVKNENVMASCISGLNEPEEFKLPSKLPTIILFNSSG